MKNEEEKIKLLLELLYIYHFSLKEYSILEHYHCEKIFKIYSLNQKITCHWLTPKIIKKTAKNFRLSKYFFH